MKLEYWKPHHDQIIRLWVSGYNYGEISKALGLGRSLIGQTILSEKGQAKIVWFRDEMDKAVIQMAAIHQQMAVIKEIERGR